MSETGNDENPTVTKARGPAYPYLDLGKALERVQQIADKGLSTRQAVPPSTIYGYWGMGLKSSSARQTMAALKYYGLVEYVGSGKDRRVRLTDAAMVLAHDKDRNSERRRATLRKAALAPEIFSEVYESEGGPYLPPEEALILNLTLDRGFDRDSAEKAVKNFLASIQLAQLDQPSQQHEDVLADNTSTATQDVVIGVAASEISVIEAAPIRAEPRTPPTLAIQPAKPSQTDTSRRENEWMMNRVSSKTTVRLLVEGEMGPREINNLIKLLEAQRAVLEIAEDDQGEIDPSN